MRARALLRAGLAGAVLSAPAAAQDVRVSVPLELTSGLVTGTESPRPFAGGVRLSLLRRLGSGATGLVGLSGGWLHDPGGATLTGGLRAGIRLPGLGLRDAGAYLVADAQRGRGRTPLSVTLLADLPLRPALFARVGVSVTRDLDRGHNEVALMLGVDVARWIADRAQDEGPRTVQP